MFPEWLNIFVIGGIALLAGGISILIWALILQALHLGQLCVRRICFDRQKQPGLFWSILGIYGFAAVAFACFSIFLLTLLGRYLF